jgi:hypothetical protein
MNCKIFRTLSSSAPTAAPNEDLCWQAENVGPAAFGMASERILAPARETLRQIHGPRSGPRIQGRAVGPKLPGALGLRQIPGGRDRSRLGWRNGIARSVTENNFRKFPTKNLFRFGPQASDLRTGPMDNCKYNKNNELHERERAEPGSVVVCQLQCYWTFIRERQESP